MRTLIAARILYTQQTDTLLPPPPPPSSNTRPNKWVHKLYSKDPNQHWAALQTAVPCLHPSHKFERVTQGPERSIQYTPPQVETRDEGEGGGREEEKEALTWFLDTFPPSQCSCSDVAWICIQQHDRGNNNNNNNNSSSSSNGSGGTQDSNNNKKKTAKVLLPPLEERIEAALDNWEQRIHVASTKKERISNLDVDTIAKKYQILKAKWLVFPSEDEVDSAWRAVAHNAVLPSPSSSISSSIGMEVKVSSVSATTRGHVLTVYCSNYLDTEEVMKVARMLQQTVPSLMDKRLLLKPDVYTYLGLYKGNEYGIRPTIMSLNL